MIIRTLLVSLNNADNDSDFDIKKELIDGLAKWLERLKAKSISEKGEVE